VPIRKDDELLLPGGSPGIFSDVSPDDDQNFPGSLTTRVIYTLCRPAGWQRRYRGWDLATGNCVELRAEWDVLMGFELSVGAQSVQRLQPDSTG